MKIIILFSILLILIMLFAINFNNIKENLTSYEDCIGKGYKKEFCTRTPVSIGGPSMCTCSDGRIGTIMPGFRGECICNNNSSAINSNLLYN